MDTEQNREIEYEEYVKAISLDSELIKNGKIEIPSFEEWLSYQLYSEQISVGKSPRRQCASN